MQQLNLAELKISGVTALQQHYPAEEARQLYHWLVEVVLGYSAIDHQLKSQVEVTDERWQDYQSKLTRLVAQEPIQYILGTTEFYGLTFAVNSSVLIPRPETEELVEWILHNHSTQSKLHLLDIGTGSGCIPVSLSKHLPNAQVSALDISADALQLAKHNADTHNLRVDFFEQDLFKLKQFPKHYDVIVSNPPYVRELERTEMQANVLEHEPDLALFVSNEDPLIFYRQIASLAAKQGQCTLYFELNQYLAKQTQMLLKQLVFRNLEVRKDFRGNARFLKGEV